jgi:hypothetical protein
MVSTAGKLAEADLLWESVGRKESVSRTLSMIFWKFDPQNIITLNEYLSCKWF